LFDNNFKSDKSIQETLEVKNHQTAFNYLLKHLSEHKIINEDLVLRMHSILMSGILPNTGLYRNHSVRIIGTNIPTANHLSINKLMSKLFLLINKKNNDIISNISKVHAEFEKIHPFSDGNGRIGRLLLIGQLLNNNLPPAIIKKEYKHYYYTYLAKAQSSDDLSLLENFICDAIIFGMEALNIK
jgi:Fic family protein